MTESSDPRPPRARRELAAVALLALLLGLRFAPHLVAPAPRADERAYLEAFSTVAAGESPYRPAGSGLAFLYPPPFAWAGAHALEVLGPRDLVLLLRALNLVGLATMLWIATRVVRPTLAAATLAALAVAVLPLPGIRAGLEFGNLSFLAIGLSLAGLSAWRRHPLLAGLMLGGGVLVKPLGAAAIVALGAHRPPPGSAGGRLAAAVAGATIAGPIAAAPFLAEFLALDLDLERAPLQRSVSLLHALWIAGWKASPLLLLGLVSVGTLIWARRRERGARELFFGAVAVSTLGTPALWGHSMLLALPLVTAGVARAVERRRSGPRTHPLARHELVLVLAAASAVLFADGVGGGAELLPSGWRVLLLAVPVLSPPALAAYLAHVERASVEETAS